MPRSLTYFQHGIKLLNDSRSYKKGEEEQSKIRRLVDYIGKDGNSLYKQVAKKNGVMEMVKV
mgnify:CR=1 FL=1